MVWVAISLFSGTAKLPCEPSTRLAWDGRAPACCPRTPLPGPRRPRLDEVKSISPPLWTPCCFSLDQESCLPMALFQHSRVFLLKPSGVLIE